ncbi:Dmt (fragment) [Xenorhabdus nematophila ATCC 19061]|uniref:Cytosine-specific methyltransferase n=1 Tax=Xenorhabdus nematophila (strain ATCC 19061 / DSM 3370 / CCUG 14189 / LMG 1036 / NCIMB 9965 / AN6) TaxID=406817 RepID=D3VKN4_XENNA
MLTLKLDAEIVNNITCTFGSVCSGIEAASVAWEPLGLFPSWFSEIEKFPSEVLRYHWPYVLNLGDMTQISALIAENQADAPDILVGGTPCQAFSIAGLRNGLGDERGKLTLSFVELANVIDSVRTANGKQPAIIVWENVPGVLSSRDNAFGCFLAGLAGEDVPLQPSGKRWTNAGYVSGPQRAVAWRVLDAQYFGVAQRRRRVFVVASARKNFCPATVLFEPDSVHRHPETRGTAGQTVAAHAGNRAVIGSHWDSELNPHPTLNQSHNTGGIGMSNQEIFSQRGSGLVSTYRLLSFGEYKTDDISSTLRSRDDKSAADLIATHDAVRRFTPVECERLQGFPDNHTQIPWNGKSAADCPDGHRYRAIGNSMAVPVMAWIGKRILMQMRQQ